MPDAQLHLRKYQLTISHLLRMYFSFPPAIHALLIPVHRDFFILRTYTLWNNNNTLLSAMLFTCFGVTVASIAVLSTTTATAPYETSGIPGITGCYQGPGSFRLFIPFLLLLAIELGLLCLTLIRAIQSWRTGNALYSVLLKHNIFYYACGLFFSAVNMLTTLLLEYAYNALFQNFQIIILAILATRMHLHLWHSERRIRGSALSVIPMSDVLFAGHTTTTSTV